MGCVTKTRQHIPAGALPEDKLRIEREMQDESRFIAMAGDDMNDAPVLAQADVSIAVGTGARVAIESARFALIKGNLDGIVRAGRLLRVTMRNIRQNLRLALIYNAARLPIAAGWLSPFYGTLISPFSATFR